MIKNFFIALLAIVTYPVFGQGNSKAIVNDNLYGAWKVDSFSSSSELGKQFNKESNRKGKNLCIIFRKDNSFSVLVDENTLSDSFHIWRSADNKTAISIFGFLLKLNEVGSERLSFDTEGIIMISRLNSRIYLSRADNIDTRQLQKKLSAKWVHEKKEEGQDGYEETLYSKGNKFLAFPVASDKSLNLNLDENGAAGLAEDNIKDTGTWAIDPKDLTLNFTGKKISRKYRILFTKHSKLYIQQLGAKDMFALRIARKPVNSRRRQAIDTAFTDMEEYDEDAVTAMPEETEIVESTVAISPKQGKEVLKPEYIYKEDNSALLHTWQAVYTISPEGKIDSTVGDLRVIFMKDGYMNIVKGKKKQSGKWHTSQYDLLIMQFGKRDYTGKFRFDYNSVNRRFSPTGDAQLLIISAVWPGEKEVRMIAFSKVKL